MQLTGLVYQVQEPVQVCHEQSLVVTHRSFLLQARGKGCFSPTSPAVQRRQLGFLCSLPQIRQMLQPLLPRKRSLPKVAVCIPECLLPAVLLSVLGRNEKGADVDMSPRRQLVMEGRATSFLGQDLSLFCSRSTWHAGVLACAWGC